MKEQPPAAPLSCLGASRVTASRARFVLLRVTAPPVPLGRLPSPLGRWEQRPPPARRRGMLRSTREELPQVVAPRAPWLSPRATLHWVLRVAWTSLLAAVVGAQVRMCRFLRVNLRRLQTVLVGLCDWLPVGPSRRRTVPAVTYRLPQAAPLWDRQALWCWALKQPVKGRRVRCLSPLAWLAAGPAAVISTLSLEMLE